MPTEFDLGKCVTDVNYNTDLQFSAGGSSDPWLSGPAKLVTEHIDLAHEYADQAFDNTWCFLTGLANYAPQLNELSYNVDFDSITLPTPVFQKPTVPSTPTIDLVIPTFPATFTPGDIHEFDENAIGTLPTFTETNPVIQLPDKPGDLEATAPGDAPSITTDFTFPEVGDYTLPTVPTFEELNIPTAPTFTIPSFELDTPTVPSTLVAPGLTFDFTEQDYNSTLLAALKTELLDRIENGGTGLHPDVEQAIWDRARNREDQNAIRVENQIEVEQTARGFARPQGSHFAALDAAAQEVQNKNASLSRDIAIQQAELEQKNIEFALQTSLALEQTLIQYHNQVQQRAFEVEKYLQQAAIDIYEAQIKQFAVQLDIYKTYAMAYESRVRGELAKAEIFRTELEGQRLIGELNLQRVQLYEAQLQGVRTSVEVYKAQVDAVQSQIQAEALKIENFKALVNVFSAQVAAKKSEYDMYSAAVQGEMAKIDIFEAQVKAFIGRIDAYSKQVDTETKRIDSDIEVQGLRIREYLARLDAVVKQMQVQSEASKAEVDLFQAQAAMFTAEVGAESSRLEAESKVYDLQIEQAKYTAQVELQNAEINLTNAANSVRLLLQAMEAGGKVGTGLAEAALSAMNIGASVQGASYDNHSYDHGEV